MFYHKYWFDRKMPVDEARLDGWLKEAVDLYLKTLIRATWKENNPPHLFIMVMAYAPVM